MIQTLKAFDGVAVTVAVRCLGVIRVSLDHEYFQGLGRVQMSARQARDLARALEASACACEAQAGEGAPVAPPQRHVDKGPGHPGDLAVTVGGEGGGVALPGARELMSVEDFDQQYYTARSRSADARRRQGGYINWPWMGVLATGLWMACVLVSSCVGR